MRLLNLTTAVLIACVSVAPAGAQPCSVSRTEKGLKSAASAEISGAAATNIVVETGPFLVTLQLEAAAKSKSYSIKAGEQVAFYTYRSGYTVAGKDWMQAGSVATHEAGFGVEWPHLLLKGKPVGNMSFEFTMGKNSGLWTTRQTAKTGREGVILSHPDGVGRPHGFLDLLYGEELDEAEYIWTGWETDILARKPLQVTFTDKSNNLKLATATFTYPSTEATMARYANDVNALRKAFTEKGCKVTK